MKNGFLDTINETVTKIKKSNLVNSKIMKVTIEVEMYSWSGPEDKVIKKGFPKFIHRKTPYELKYEDRSDDFTEEGFGYDKRDKNYHQGMWKLRFLYPGLVRYIFVFQREDVVPIYASKRKIEEKAIDEMSNLLGEFVMKEELTDVGTHIYVLGTERVGLC
jgi:hypothetical protein